MTAVVDHAPADVTSLEAVPAPLPRVNLLPPEIADRARLRRVQLGLGAGLLAATGVVGGLYAGAVAGVQDATQELAATSSAGVALRAESAKYVDVQRVHAEAGQAQAMLASAMAGEVRFSSLLDDLSRNVPDAVWLENVTFTQSTASAPAQTAPGATPGVGTVTFTGVGRTHDDVAAWLDSLAEQEGYADAYFSKSTAGTKGGRASVSFTSTATLTPDTLSGRYTETAGG